MSKGGKKKRSTAGLILDVVLTLCTGGLWLIWILIRYLRNKGYRGVSKKHTPAHIATVFKISTEGVFREPFQLFQCLQGSITHDI